MPPASPPHPSTPFPPSGPATDEALLARFVRGDTGALGLLAQRYEPALLGLARALVGGRMDLACDAVQESWVRVIRHARGYSGTNGASVKTWLYRIVINRCKDLRDARARSDNLAMQAAESGRLDGPSADAHRGDLGQPSQDPALRGEFNVRLLEALDDVSPGARLIVLLCYHHGLTHPQVAQVLDVPLGTVKSRLSAALSQLRERLTEEEVAR